MLAVSWGSCAVENIVCGMNGKKRVGRGYQLQPHTRGSDTCEHRTGLSARILSWTHTSTGTHLSTTSNIFTKTDPFELKLCICALVDIPITIVVFFVCQVARKTRLKKGPLSRWPMDAVSELQPATRSHLHRKLLGVLSWNSSLFWTVTGCDRSKGGSQSKCGSMIVFVLPIWVSKPRLDPAQAQLLASSA